MRPIRGPSAPVSPTWRRVLGCVLLGLLVASCDEPVGPILPVATTLSVSDGTVALSWLGETLQVSATVFDQTGAPLAGSAPTWTSLDPAVASVSSSGVITAVGNGTTTVHVDSGTLGAQVEVTVAQVAVSMSLAPDTLSFGTLGDTATVGVTLLDFGGAAVTGAAVDWLALDDGVASVASDGLVTAVSNGVTVVAATARGQVATVHVTVAQTPGAIVLSTGSVTFDALGDTTRVLATVTDPGGADFIAAPVTWATSDSSVAVVSAGGLLTAVGNGSATLFATAEAVSAQAAVTVAQAVAAMSLQPDSVVLADPGDTAAFVVGAWDALGSPVVAPTLVWSSVDDGVATVDAAGVVTAVGTGTTAISVAAGAVVATGSARVVPELTLVATAPPSVTAEVATAVSLSVRVEDVLGPAYEGAAVTWSVDTGGGTVTSSQVVTSDASGHAGAVWALGTVAGLQTASASLQSRGSTVTVTFTASAVAGPAASAALAADSALLSGAGETVYLAPSFLDAYGNAATPTAVGWASTDPGVAQVAADGLVTGQGAGTAYVTLSLGAGVDSILITLVPRGAITVSFDDGWLTTYTDAWSVMQEFGFAGNVAVYTEAVGFPAYMSEAQLQELHDDGWSLVSHTVSHDSLTTLSDAELDYELRTSRQWLIDRGFGRGADIFIAPYHDYTGRERLAASAYYRASRGASANSMVPDTMVFWQPSNPYELTGIDVDQLPYTTPAGRDQLRVMLQRTLDEGRFLDVLFHQVPTANADALRATLTVIDEFRDRVLPYHRLYPQLARVVQ